ncbi:pantothenate kinase 1 isoform X2 [Pistacia vera]|uniref:pantothenate kinase 1 isoform X2 n=1 Tax=Pistacia vera TaxID=55513 RepID=UPI001262B591|nr:pantothenate kinase 1 isoform X2 [Pistacia vera]
MEKTEGEIIRAKLDSDQSQSQISHLALDIGGSLIKLVYFSKNNGSSDDDDGNNKHLVLQGRLHFAKFETCKINDCIEFIRSKKLHLGGVRLHDAPASDKILVKATGGGAYKFADLIKEKLGIIVEKEDEMDCLVAGANFLLKAVHQEAFTYMDGQKEFVHIDINDLYPYLLVNIGSGVSMIKVDGDGKFERISGTSVGGGTFWGLGRLLTKCKSFDELLELSREGNNRVIDMLVGDIYGGVDYSKIGLLSTAIASSFGKAISDNKELEDYKPEDVARSLLRLISNNIGQIAYLNALQFGLKRIFFAGFFIRGHAYTMDTISVGVHFWSKGEAKAMFLRHEGFLGSLGAFMSYDKHGLDDLSTHQLVQRFPVSGTNAGEKICCPLVGDLNDNDSIECGVYAA